MDWLYVVKTFVLGIVEGLTEFLPVSSTGHLIVVGDLIGFTETGADTFYIAIQAGAILAVCWHYRVRLWSIARHLFSSCKEQRLAINTVIAFLPAALIGVVLSASIKTYLFNAVAVAAALVIGGVVILWVEHWNTRTKRIARVATMDEMSAKDAFAVGCMQCLALIPGTSRSGATIIGAMVWGLSRTAATEFSFFLAIPTIFGATVYDLYKSRALLSIDNLPGIGIGFVVSFFSAILVVRWLLRYVSKNDFRCFGWYRIVFGLVILLTWKLGLADF